MTDMLISAVCNAVLGLLFSVFGCAFAGALRSFTRDTISRPLAVVVAMLGAILFQGVLLWQMTIAGGNLILPNIAVGISAMVVTSAIVAWLTVPLWNAKSR